MTAGTLRIPVLVTHRKAVGFRVSCLFLPQLDAVALRYESALDKLRQTVLAHFRGLHADRSTLDERLWLTFAPPLHFELVALGFNAGRRWIEGLFAAAQFTVGARRYACLPQLGGTVADLGESRLDRAQRIERLVAHIQFWLRTQHKEQGSGFDPLKVLAAPTDELGELELSMSMPQGRFPFERRDNLLAALRDDTVGDGATETARVAVDLNELYPERLSHAILRDELVHEVHHAIERSDAGALVLVGPRGVGKTALVHGALRRHLEASRPAAPKAGQPTGTRSGPYGALGAASEASVGVTDHADRDRQRLAKLWHLDPMRVISGMSVIGQWQRRMAVVLEYVQRRLREGFRIERSDHIYCDNLVALLSVGRSSQNSLTLADMLRPHLEQRMFTFIGEATPEAWQKVQQRDRRFADLFRVVRVEPMPRATAIRVVAWRRAALELEHECSFDAGAMAELLELERRFAVDEVMPGSALRVLERLAVRHARKPIGRAAVTAAYTEAWHFREKLFSRHVGLAPADAQAFFAARLIGQPEARAHLVDVVALIKSGLAAPGKPLASLLFIGPTGVGKSEAAKLLADYLFEGDGGLLRFDMNEYVDGSALDRLIGDAHRPEGQLTAAVRQRRACVLLLDEIEKAHPAVHDLLLQLLGEGRLTDAAGRTTDFSQCVVVLTSNLGAVAAQRRTGFTHNAADASHTYREAVERFFRPEFLNRIDQVVAFTPLGRDDIAAIARLQLERVLSRDGFVRRLTFLVVSPDALDHLALLAHDQTLGARALKRGLERSLTGPVAQRLASSHVGQPMLLDISLHQGQLVTNTSLLHFAPPRPAALPEDTGTPDGYRRVRDIADALHERLYAILDGDVAPAVALEVRALQVWLGPLRDVLERRCWDLDQRRSGAPPRTARAPKAPSREWLQYGARSIAGDFLAHHDIRAFFEQLQADAQPARGVDAELVRWQLELNLMSQRIEALTLHGIEQVALEVRPLVRGSASDAALAAARADDVALLRVLGAHELPPPFEGARAFEGVGLQAALAGECGVHLWYVGDARPVPLAVRVWPLAQGASGPPMPDQVIRIRVEPGTTAGDQRRLSDLRSGRVRRFTGPLTDDDWRLLLWDARAGVAPEG